MCVRRKSAAEKYGAAATAMGGGILGHVTEEEQDTAGGVLLKIDRKKMCTGTYLVR